MKLHALLLCVLVLPSFSACATRGPNFRMEDTRRVEIGMTEAEVIQIMGSQPSDVHEDATGELWMWNYVAVSLASSRSKSFAVKFKGGQAVSIQR